jgi:signal peptidase I
MPGSRQVAVREIVHSLLFIGLFVFAARGALQNFRVEGPSMLPTLTSGQYLWVNKAAYTRVNGQYILGGPQRGDVAVLRAPDATADVDLIKRIIGLPGDRVAVHDQQVFINGQALDEPYIHFMAGYTFGEAEIPSGEYFVLGDNRANSRDSHYGWFVPAEDLVGRAWLTYWPPAEWGVLPGVAYALR